MVAAEVAMCLAPCHTSARRSSSRRSVTRMRSHGCQLRDEGARRPASRIWSRCSSGMARSWYWRTLRRARMASQVSMPTFLYLSAGDGACADAAWGAWAGLDRCGGRVEVAGPAQRALQLAGGGLRQAAGSNQDDLLGGDDDALPH